jgi:hypothetical protein
MIAIFAVFLLGLLLIAWCPLFWGVLFWAMKVFPASQSTSVRFKSDRTDCALCICP